ncbi:hypothetical protein [Leclercia adecarboxylata]|uniref:hypothetical protein n=1 Tax=Leclercia adecarboxylata TaxID=83655 RepID=UPI0022E24B96|nr:hypothetical protein [Leclercia adecarboxylata]WJT02283.1 hypothetical protein OCT50_16990 [Leclercia adecarboxylata]
MNKDNVTLWSNKALSILFFNYPIRSAIGILVGIIIWFGFETYPILFEFLQTSNSQSAKIFFSLLGYMIIHSKTLIEGISGNILSEDVKQTLNLIHIANVPDAQKRRMYEEAITKRINALDKHDIEDKKDETAGE